MVTKNLFGICNGTEVYEFSIENGGLKANIIEFGATIHNLWFDGVDVVAGYDDLEGYVNGGSNQGATVGRYANRIGGAKFKVNGVTCNVDPNDNEVNHLHGGFCGFAYRMYEGEVVGDNSVKFSISSPDGEGGYPGNLTLSVTFTIEDDTLKIKYDAVADKDTYYNFTNHAYFNLGADNIYSTELMIKADAFTPTDDLLIPTGEVRDVTDTPFDFRTAKPIGRDIGSDYQPVALCGGYDHNFVLGTKKEYKKDCVVAYCPESKITMSCSTDLPGVQIYTSNMLDEPRGKGNKPLTKHYAFCVETQFWPDSPNKPEFPSCFAKANEPFASVTEYKFSK